MSRIFRLARFRSAVALLPAVLLLASSCSRTDTHGNKPGSSPSSVITTRATAEGSLVISTRQAEFEVMKSGGVRAWLILDGRRWTLDRVPSPEPAASGHVVVGGEPVDGYLFDVSSARTLPVRSAIGDRGLRVEMTGRSERSPLERLLWFEVYEDFPALMIAGETYRNGGQETVRIDRAVFQSHLLDASLVDPKRSPEELWSFHGSSSEWGRDDVVKLAKGLSRQNLTGVMLAGGWGGGIPVIALWTDKIGVAIGHIETAPLELSLPVAVRPNGRVQASLVLEPRIECKPGEPFHSPRTFVCVYRGDFYEPLRAYSQVLQRQGWQVPEPSPEAYQISWCGWGYEFDVTPAQMLGTIPKLKELGIRWATLDDRWFQNYGDWEPRSDTFPGDSVRRMVDGFHREGLLVQLWWLVLGVETGEGKYGSHRYVQSKVAREHPEWLILDQAGRPSRMVRNLSILCPALPEVQDYYRKLTEKFVRDWGFDGHKLDVAFTVPRCYNPRHRHSSPDDSVQALGKVFKVIFETTRSLKPAGMTQICPCGTPPNPAWLPYMDQAVTADPVGAAQVRQRIKMYKALLGPRSAVYGDHVELSEMKRSGREWLEVGEDFASTVGLGGVPGTKFTWPDYGPKFGRVFLTPAKETHWKKWTALYKSMMLSQGEFQNLYVHGYDIPEGYAIRRGSVVYYAFFAPDPAGEWKGELELRGLSAGAYRVRDYENDRSLREVRGPTARLSVEFKGHLLLEARP